MCIRDSFNVNQFYEKHHGGNKIEQLRNEFLEKYDFILIDSRTGLTDFGGICTIHFPDILILLFTPTEQSLEGVIDVAKKAVSAQMNLPYDREKLLTFPVPTRVDSNTEFQITQDWIKRFANELDFAYNDWVPTAISKKDFIESIKIPYIPFFSYGEQLPVVIQGINDKSGLGLSLIHI